MINVPQNELNLARHMVLWFVQCGGEVSLEDLAVLCGAPERLVEPVIREFDPGYEDEGFASFDILPCLWEALAPQSRVSLALHSALQMLLKEGDARAVQGMRDRDSILEILRSSKS